MPEFDDDDDVVSDDDLVAVEEGESDDAADDEEDGGMAAATRPAKQQGTPRPEPTAADGDEAALQLSVPGGEAAASLDAAVLQLEVSDLLNNVRLDYSKETDVVRFVAQLKKVLCSIPEHNVNGSEAAGFVRDLGFDPQELNLQFKPPTKVSVVGSFALHTMTPSSTTVDLSIQIPDDCLFKKAHLNYRYHARRALYLMAISSHLSSLDPSVLGPLTVELAAAEHDPTRPALLLKFDASAAASTSGPAVRPAKRKQAPPPAGFHSPQGLTVRLLPVAGPGVFTIAKLAPDRNSVRWHVKPKAAKKPPAATEPGVAAALATPRYNSAVLHDAVSGAHHAFLASALSAAPRLVDGVVLLKTWARQRGMLGQPDSMDSHMITMLVAHLAQQGKVAGSMAPLQIFRQALLALSEALPKGLLMARSDPAACAALCATSPAAHPPSQACFRKHFDVVFIDFSGWVNLAANMSKSALQQTVSMSKRTLAVLQNPGDADEAFAAALLGRESPAAAFDYVWKVRLAPAAAAAAAAPAAAAAATAGEDSQVSGVAADQVFWRQQEQKVQSVVQQALTDRAHLVRVLGRRVEAGQDPGVLRQGLPRPSGAGEVLVAAHMDPTLALRLVDVGPAADDAAAAARFRAFWGSRSELRRFQDGRICEAVVWELAPSDRHHVPDRAVAAAAALHLPPGSSVTSCSGALDPALRQQHQAARRHPAANLASTSASSFRQIEAAVDKLGKQLRALEGTALKVVGFQPISAVNRQTCPFFPVPHPLAGGPALAPSDPLPRCLEPIAVMVQLESSGRWPDDPQAFAKTKAALGLQLAAALEAGYGYKTMGSEECVDVLMEGFAFRLFFHSARDEAMLSKSLSAAPPAPGAPLLAQAPGLVLSWHHGLISAVSGVNPAFAPAARLAKRWASCQLLSQHLPDEALELLVAAVFSGPSALPPPGSRMSGFLRFLTLLSTYPWASKPLLVDPEHQLTKAQRQQLLRRFSTKKEAAGGQVPAMYICTPRDLESTHWTHTHPTAATLAHACAMAAKSLRLLSALVEQGHAPAAAASLKSLAPPSDELWLAAFVPPLESYDVLLLLREEALPQAHRALPGMAELLAPPSGKAAAPAAGAALGPWSCRQPDALTADDMQKEGPPAKRARVFLRAFPDLVASRGPSQLLPELLVGFDPVGLLLVALGERFGHLAHFYADVHGGCRAVGVKWQPQAFLPAPLKANVAHAMLPCQLTMASRPRAAPTCVPNVIQVLAEIKEVGQGLVEDVVVAPSCRRML